MAVTAYKQPITDIKCTTHLTTAPVKVTVMMPYFEEKNSGLSSYEPVKKAK